MILWTVMHLSACQLKATLQTVARYHSLNKDKKYFNYYLNKNDLCGALDTEHSDQSAVVL